jgi:hypothetical protein
MGRFTVSGECPMVDVSSTATQTNVTRNLYEAIPTGRKPGVIGTTWSRPSLILTPRIVRFGVTARF